MAETEGTPRSWAGRRALRAVVFGADDPRLRATWRYLLAAPLVLLVGVVTGAVTGTLGLSGMLPGALVQVGAFGALLVGWARYVDRRPLREYGLDASPAWLLDLLVAFAAVLLAHVAWYALGAALGWTTVDVVASAPQGSFALALAGTAVAIVLNVLVQDTVFFGVALQNAAEGLNRRGLTPRRAVLGGWLAAILFVVVIHNGSLERLVGLTAAGVFFGLLYVHTGELALSAGFHAAVNFSGGWLFALSSRVGEGPVAVAVSETLPVLDALGDPRVPQMLLAYLALAAWLHWRRGGLGIESAIARWRGR